MASYLITGCSRGLGLEMTKILSSSAPDAVSTVFATARNLTPALKEVIDASNGRVQFVTLDVLDESSITAAVSKVTQLLGPDKGLDVLINSAGIQILEKSATQMHALQETLSINVIAVHNVSSAFMPLLSQGTQKKLLIISSELGSMEKKDYSALAPFPSYKISKAALNMLVVQYAMELAPKGYIVFAVSPGWLKTDLGGPHADLEPAVGAQQVIEIVQNATPQDNGKLRQIYVEGSEVYDGKYIPW